MDPTYGEKPTFQLSPPRTEDLDKTESDLEQNEEAINGGREIGALTIPEAPSHVTKPFRKRIPIPREQETKCFEIFEVRVFHGRKTSGKIHGTIYIESAMGFHDLYRRNRKNAETISLPGTITLAGLPIAIRADDPFVMHLDLWHGREEVSKGFTTENSPYGGSRTYDKVITEEVKGRNGAAVVTYAIVSNGVLACVTVKLLKGNRKSGARIYGTITASMTGWNAKRLLFCKKREKYTSVNSNAPIPLLRSVLIVPHISDLHIEANLLDVFSFPNVPVVRGDVKFSPDCDCAKTISGKFGQIEVDVAWWSYYDHKDTFKVRMKYGV